MTIFLLILLAAFTAFMIYTAISITKDGDDDDRY